MKKDLYINAHITIPHHELEITVSRAGGPGGQHVNKTNSRITVHWNVRTTHSMPDYLKERIIRKLGSSITGDGYIIVHNSSSRSQQQNREAALATLAALICKAVHVPKKRIPTKISAGQRETRLRKKSVRSTLKKSRRIEDDF